MMEGCGRPKGWYFSGRNLRASYSGLPVLSISKGCGSSQLSLSTIRRNNIRARWRVLRKGRGYRFPSVRARCTL